MFYRKTADPWRSEADLLKVYRRAFEKAKFQTEIEDKLLTFNEVIEYCLASKQCVKNNSKKRNQVLFWVYTAIGNMFLQKNAAEPEPSNYLYAVQYFQNALEFTKSTLQKRSILEKMVEIYTALQDEDNRQKTLEELVFMAEDADKSSGFLSLAAKTDNPVLQIKYLENALDFISKQNVSVYQKATDTLQICDHLLSLYHFFEDEPNIQRITDLQEKMHRILN